MLSARSQIEVRIKSLDNESFIVDISPSDTVMDLKERIAFQAGLKPAEFTLVYHGEILVDELSLNYYGIVYDTTVYLSMNKTQNKVGKKPQLLFQKLKRLVPMFNEASKKDYYRLYSEIKEIIENPLLIGFSRLDSDIYDYIMDVRELLDNSSRPSSGKTEMFLARSTDIALNQFDSSIEGLRILQSIMSDDYSDEEIQVNYVDADVPTKPMTKPLTIPKSSSKSFFQSIGVRTTFNGFHRVSMNSQSFKKHISPKTEHECIEPVDLREKFAKQVDALKNMGFEDEKTILQALGEANGNVQKAYQLLQHKSCF